jgi:hypothetical protein
MADAKDGIITLVGHVHTWAEHDAVAGAALMVRGVIGIRDDFRSPADRHRQGGDAQRGFPDLGGHYHRQRHGTGRSRLPSASGSGPGNKDIRYVRPVRPWVGGWLSRRMLRLAASAAVSGQQCPAGCCQ